MTSKMTRKNTLEAALQYVLHDRNRENGDPEDNFRRIAWLWTYWLREKYGASFDLSTTDVAMMSLMIKIARLVETEINHDNWIDIAGYAACGAECADKENVLISDDDFKNLYDALEMNIHEEIEQEIYRAISD